MIEVLIPMENVPVMMIAALVLAPDAVAIAVTDTPLGVVTDPEVGVASEATTLDTMTGTSNTPIAILVAVSMVLPLAQLGMLVVVIMLMLDKLERTRTLPPTWLVFTAAEPKESILLANNSSSIVRAITPRLEA